MRSLIDLLIFCLHIPILPTLYLYYKYIFAVLLKGLYCNTWSGVHKSDMTPS